MHRNVKGILELTEDLRQGFDHVVVLGMGVEHEHRDVVHTARSVRRLHEAVGRALGVRLGLEDRLDLVVFFWDPLEPQPHDVDVKALLRIAVVYNVPIACNRATADFLLSSPLLRGPYQRMAEPLQPLEPAAV